MRRAFLIAAACAACVEWTRITGRVKAVNLREQTVTVQNREKDLLTVPIDYQVTILDKGGEIRQLKSLSLDEKVTLTRVPAEKPRPDDEGLAPPEQPIRGR